MSLGEEEFLLKWHDHHTSFFHLLEELVTREQLTDVTLACGETILNAHSLMLSVCSPYFRSLLSENLHREKHHIIHLNGVTGRHMQQLLVYMYRGEISICQDDLGPLIETARCLQIKGLAMATSDMTTPTTHNPNKRSASQLSDLQIALPKSKERKIVKNKNNQVKCSVAPPTPPPAPLEVGELSILNQSIEEDILVKEEDYLASPESVSEAYYSPPGKGGSQHQQQQQQQITQLQLHHQHPTSGVVALPLLPKPLSVLKTAETRTYLSKLIWLGNGGRRPQYGNPETKPCWWPQHVLPWEEMKKMGGRKSQELSHINYTEILKQCLAAGYEYFGYDPSTYFSSEPQDQLSVSDLSLHHGDEGEHGTHLANTEESGEEEAAAAVVVVDSGAAVVAGDDPPLQIDLESVTTTTTETSSPPTADPPAVPVTKQKQIRNQNQILCK